MQAWEDFTASKGFVFFMFPNDPISQMWKLRLCNAFRASGSVSDTSWGCAIPLAEKHLGKGVERLGRGLLEGPQGPPTWGGKLRNLNQNEDREGGHNSAHCQGARQAPSPAPF